MKILRNIRRSAAAYARIIKRANRNVRDEAKNVVPPASDHKTSIFEQIELNHEDKDDSGGKSN